jgi:hypothetical protein
MPALLFLKAFLIHADLHLELPVADLEYTGSAKCAFRTLKADKQAHMTANQ